MESVITVLKYNYSFRSTKNVFWQFQNTFFLSVRMLGTSVCVQFLSLSSRDSQTLRFCSRVIVYAQSLWIACWAVLGYLRIKGNPNVGKRSFH